jgi:hypothetical protein
MDTRLPGAPASRPFEDSLYEPMLRELYDYWSRKRGARLMPRRRDIDPAEIPKLLPHIMITEMLEGGTRYRYRLSGTAVTRAFGRELTGLYVDEVMKGAYREFLERVYRTIYLKRRCVYCESQYAGSSNPGLTTKRLLMPLSEDGLEVNQVLVVQTFYYASASRDVVIFDSQDRFVDTGIALTDGGAK